MELHEIIAFYRKQKGFTQLEAAEKLFISEKTLSAYETGKRMVSTDMLYKLAALYDKEVKDFFDSYHFQRDQQLASPHIHDVTYVSVWDDGYVECSSSALYDDLTNTVFWIEAADCDGVELNHCDREYIILPDGSEKDVIPLHVEDWEIDDDDKKSLEKKELVRIDKTR
jgi:transcriptional regulator with XRE-family HTH domain